jgi:hypothetical protein
MSIPLGPGLALHTFRLPLLAVGFLTFLDPDASQTPANGPTELKSCAKPFRF